MNFELHISMYYSSHILTQGLVYAFEDQATYIKLIDYMGLPINYEGTDFAYHILVQSLDSFGQVQDSLQLRLHYSDRREVLNIINQINYFDFKENNLLSNKLAIVKSGGRLDLVKSKISLDEFVELDEPLSETG